MTKTVKAIMLIVVTLFAVPIGGRCADAPLPDPVVFSETLLTDSQKGFESQTETDHAWYLFSGGTENEWNEWIQKAETILAVARDECWLQPENRLQLKLYFDTESDRTQIDLSSASVTLGLQSGSHRGALFFYMSGGKLPAWLCAGLELHHLELAGLLDAETNAVDVSKWCEEAATKGLPGIGDEWMIPGLIDDALAEDAHGVALAFVRKLMEADTLAELMDLYMDGKSVWEAERRKNELWAVFSNEGSVTVLSGNDLIYQFLYNQKTQIRLYEPFHSLYHAFTILTEYSKCYFGSDGWSLDDANHYASVSLEGLRYAKNWFGEDIDEPVTVLYCLRRDDNAFAGLPAMYLGNSIIFIPVNQTWFSPFGIVHESVHLFADRLDLTADFPQSSKSLDIDTLFEEGLATALDSLHMMKSENEKYVSDTTRYVYALLELFWGDGYLDAYSARTRYIDYTPDKIDLAAYSDMVAVLALNNTDQTHEALLELDQEQFLDLLEAEAFQDEAEPIGASDLFVSFTLYLLERSPSNEAFLEAYTDASLMKKHYGKDLWGMMHEWLEDLLCTES